MRLWSPGIQIDRDNWSGQVLRTGWRRLIGSPKLQIIFHKRVPKYRSLLRKNTCQDKGSYESSPPSNIVTIAGTNWESWYFPPPSNWAANLIPPIGVWIYLIFVFVLVSCEQPICDSVFVVIQFLFLFLFYPPFKLSSKSDPAHWRVDMRVGGVRGHELRVRDRCCFSEQIFLAHQWGFFFFSMPIFFF